MSDETITPKFQQTLTRRFSRPGFVQQQRSVILKIIKLISASKCSKFQASILSKADVEMRLEYVSNSSALSGLLAILLAISPQQCLTWAILLKLGRFLR